MMVEIERAHGMIHRLWLAAAFAMIFSAASAQTTPQGPAPTSQMTNAGAAGVAARMQSQGYSEIHNLHRGPDGKWVGEAVRNGVPFTVTADPDGKLIAR
jgi:hypothetical protein